LYIQFVIAVQIRVSLIQPAFSCSHSHIDRVMQYILNRGYHHKKKLFREEYQELLTKFEIDYDERYVLNDLYQYIVPAGTFCFL